MLLLRRALSVACLSGLALLPWPAAAQHFARHTLRAADYDAETFVAPSSALHKRAGVATSTIQVRFINQASWPAAAQNAFSFAADLWETHLESSQTITIEARFESLDEGVLGSAGPSLIADFGGGSLRDTWYASALAEAIAERDFTGADAEIFATFNSDFDNWYFGTDGNTPAGQFDFVSVVMHELGHGLGFTGSFDVDDGDPSTNTECNGQAGFGCWGFEANSGEVFPIIYDRFVEDENEVPLLDESAYPNPSIVLGDVLQSEQVFFEADAVLSANDDVPVDLYAPSNFEPGSSFSHLDEESFRPGNPNSLMTPFLGRAEAIFSPGPVTCAIFQEIGWPLGPDCQGLLAGGLTVFDADLVGEAAVLTWTISGAEDFSAFRIEQRFFEGSFFEIGQVAATGMNTQTFEFRVDGLEPGRYGFRLVLVRDDGSTSLGPIVELIVPLDGNYALTEVFPNPATGAAQLDLQVRQTQPVRADLYDAQGRHIATLADRIVQNRDRLRLAIDAGSLAAGIYFVRVVGSDFAQTRTVVIL